METSWMLGLGFALGLVCGLLCAPVVRRGLARGAVVRGAASSASTEVPETVSRLLREIQEGEFGGQDFSETGISTCWVKLPENRTISARWYSSGQRSELQMRKGKCDYVELPYDKWSEMILAALIKKTRDYHNQQLEGLLSV